MKTVLSGCIMLLIVVAGIPAQASEPLVLYDDFNATFINPNKWIGGEFGDACREAVRQIVSNRLQLLSRAYGHTNADTGQGLCHIFLSHPNPAAVTAMTAKVEIRQVETTGCATFGSDVTEASAQLHGRFFNT